MPLMTLLWVGKVLAAHQMHHTCGIGLISGQLRLKQFWGFFLLNRQTGGCLQIWRRDASEPINICRDSANAVLQLLPVDKNLFLSFCFVTDA